MYDFYKYPNIYNTFDPYYFHKFMNHYYNFNVFREEEKEYEKEIIESEDRASNYIRDYGPDPFAINIDKVTKQNNTFRTTLWTGNHLQVTLMSIKPGENIGLESHPNVDQFVKIVQGDALVKMGNSKENLDFQKRITNGSAFVIPAGKWHDLINMGSNPIKLYSIYAPPQHPRGTVHITKADDIH